MVPNIDLKGFLIFLVVISAIVGWAVIEFIILAFSHLTWI